MSAATPEPPPTPGQVDIWPLVLKDIEDRVKAGEAKYGTVLQSHNGRDALMDAYQENIDMLLYQRQAIREITDLKAEILQLRMSETMSLKNDVWIAEMCECCYPLIAPFIPHQVSDGVISYGLGGHGYDLRVADEFEIFTNIGNGARVVDPKNFDPELLHRYQGAVCTIPPNSFALARSIEYFRIPRNIVGICLGKSTYARLAIITNFTPLEAGWEGHLTIEISNTSPLPALIYANEGIAQCLFFESDPAGVGYGDRDGGGKYQGQTGITKAKV